MPFQSLAKESRTVACYHLLATLETHGYTREQRSIMRRLTTAVGAALVKLLLLSGSHALMAQPPGDRAWTTADLGEAFTQVYTFRVAGLTRGPIHTGFHLGKVTTPAISVTLADAGSRSWQVVSARFQPPGAEPFTVSPPGRDAKAEPHDAPPVAVDFLGTAGPGHIGEHEISLYLKVTAAGWGMKVADEAGGECSEIIIPFAVIPESCALTPFVTVPPGLAKLNGKPLHAEIIASPAPVTAPEKGEFGTVKYQLFKPAVRPDETYPLVVCLHGARGAGRDNRGRGIQAYGVLRAADVQAKHPSFLLVPQKPEGPQLWAGSHYSKGSYDLDKAPETPHLKSVHDLIVKVMEEHPIDPARVYVTGQSMGGYGTWDIALRYPELFAAAIPICGGGSPQHAARLKNMAVWSFHGDQDTAVPVEASRDMDRALRAAGASKARYTEFPGAGHVIMDEVWDTPGIIDWLFSQRREPPTPLMEAG